MNAIEKIIEEIINYFMYSPFVIMINKYNKKTDEAILEYLEKDINRVEIDSHHMYLFSNDMMMSVWISNKWYAFGSEVSIGTIDKSKDMSMFKKGRYTFFDMYLLSIGAKSYSGRPSFKTLRILKHIYQLHS